MLPGETFPTAATNVPSVKLLVPLPFHPMGGEGSGRVQAQARALSRIKPALQLLMRSGAPEFTSSCAFLVLVVATLSLASLAPSEGSTIVALGAIRQDFRILEHATQATHGRVALDPKHKERSIVPAQGVLLGALVDQRDGIFWSQRRVLRFERMIGHKLSIDHYFYWTTPEKPCIGEIPRNSREGWDISNGRIPMASWTPEPPDASSPWLNQYMTGSMDSCFRTVARALKSIGGPVLLRFMHEMNGNWYPWSGPQNGGGHEGELKYREVWIHVWKIFRAEGATNVRWVWCPDSTDTPADGSHHWTGYYPGDKYVDWVCVDSYNWNAPDSGWSDFKSLFTERTAGHTVYEDYATRKPFMIGETGTVEDPSYVGRKGKWFLNARTTIKKNFPLLKALVYFDTIADDKDWRVGTSPTSIAGFRALASDKEFRTVRRR